MNSDDGSKYIQNYQQNLFQRTSNNLFKYADVSRKCIAQTFKESINQVNNSATCDVLDEMLASYTELIDDQNGINNYADTLKVLTSQLAQRDYSQWKSNISSYDIKDLLEPLSCGDINCNSSKVTEEQIRIIFQNKNDNIVPIKPNKFVQSTVRQDTFSNNLSSNLQKPAFKTSANSNFSNNAPQNIQQPSYSKNVYSNNINKPSYSNNTKNLSPRDSTRDMQETTDRYSMFKTAKDELHAQNLKKYGRSNGNEQQSLNYGGQKRSLGTRRGVQTKFIPPIKMDTDCGAATLYRNNNQNNYAEEFEEIDERLKNIDSKMVELIRSEIMDSGPPISWDDIAGLEFAKTAIKEAVVWPLLRPDIFTGLRRPPKGILLFGPPGTGKTLIGKCIASQSQSTFFSISASSLTSKWIGDGEKMVRAMFAVARCHQPAVIFIDEIDSLLSQRSDTEHESSRRIKTEFLVQLDGAATAEEDRILLVGATNRPQELDEAARRRFVKRLYIPLPEKTARLEIVKRLMCTERNDLLIEDIETVAELSDGYSGADMKNLCSEASLGPIRSIDINFIQNIQADEVRPVTMDDFKSALNRVRTSVSPADLEQYVSWDKTYGSGGW